MSYAGRGAEADESSSRIPASYSLLYLSPTIQHYFLVPPSFSPSSSPQTYAQNAGRGSSPFPREITIPRGSSVTGRTATATAHLQKKSGSPERSRTLSPAWRTTHAVRHQKCQTPTERWAFGKSLNGRSLVAVDLLGSRSGLPSDVSKRHACRKHFVSICYATFIARTVSARPCWC